MKKIKSFSLLAVLFILFSFSDNKETTIGIDAKAEEVAINELLDKIITSFEKQDAATLINLLSEEAMILGSAPEQVFTKEQISAAWTQVLEQTAMVLKPISDRQINIASDGKSASAIEQFTMPDAYTNIVFRNSFHLVKQDKEWKVLCWNGACIMGDEDLLKLNELLSE